MDSVPILTRADMGSLEEFRKERENYTDEDARKLGYPNVAVLHLEDKLSLIAGTWRDTKDDALVAEYRQTLYEMILKGYDVHTLPIQDQLPDRHMPELPPKKVLDAIVAAYKEPAEAVEEQTQ